ncbi:alpha-1A adrenergic receptor-like [Acanthaster planci]|uniref:Alpha-1A adrenergic receptor-like n=1 Tax=Acanthaster planci TaxID=133434 RepID=A0A8B7ZLY8_ACAPL|nr:alpha-1A adrenergic receptor-like [Acanthaster planci]
MGSESDMVESGNVTYEDVEASTGRQVIYIVLYTALLVLIVFGNCFLLFVIAKDRTLKRSTRIFLISLTVADIFVGVVVIPLKVVPQIIGLSSVSPWTVSDRLCNASYFLEIFASSASVLGVLVLTIERYLAVEIPLRFRSIMTARRACIIVACSWLLSAVPAASFVVMSAAAEKGITAFNEFSWRMRAFRASALRQISQCLPVRSNLCRGKLVKPKSVNRVTKSDTGDSRM